MDPNIYNNFILPILPQLEAASKTTKKVTNPLVKNGKIKVWLKAYKEVLNTNKYIPNPITFELEHIAFISEEQKKLLKQEETIEQRSIDCIKYLSDQTFYEIVHLADIHIPLHFGEYKEEMYRSIFDKFYQFIKQLKAPLVIVVGDFLHIKDNFKASMLILAKEFMEQVQKICPLVVTLGNHDFAKNNKDIPDNISAIKNDDLIFLKESNIYQIGNYTFGFMSEFDEIIVQSPHKKAIALYHQDWPNDQRFNGYQCGMFGHFHEYSNPGGNCWYSGSLIQQNFGEPIDNHGFILWIPDDNGMLSHKFIPIENDYIYLNWYFDDPIPNNKKIFMRCHLKEDEKEPIATNILTTEIRKIDSLKQIIHQVDPELVTFENDIKLIQQYSHMPDEVIALHKEIYKGNKDLSCKPWNILYLEFQNVFIYGNDHINTINFQNGVYNLSAPNTAGKSSITNIILFALFDTINGRDHILNDHSKKGYIKLVFQHIDGIFKIEKDEIHNARDKGELRTKCKNSFRKQVMSNNINDWQLMNGKNETETKQIIQSYVGTLDIFKTTNIIAPYIDGSLLKMQDAEVKKFFEKLTKTEFYTEQYKEAKKRYNELDNKSKFKAGQIDQMKQISQVSDDVENELILLKQQQIQLKNIINEIEIKNKQTIDKIIQLKSQLSVVEEVNESKEELEFLANQETKKINENIPKIQYHTLIQNDEDVESLIKLLLNLNDIVESDIDEGQIRDDIDDIQHDFKQLQFLSNDFIEDCNCDLSINDALSILLNTDVVSSKHVIDEQFLNQNYIPLDKLKYILTTKINNMKEKYNQTLNESIAKKTQLLHDIQLEYVTKTNEFKQEYDKQLSILSQDLHQKTNQLDIKKQEKTNNLKLNHDKSINELSNNHQLLISKHDILLKKELDDCDSSYQNQLLSLKTHHEKIINELKLKIIDEVSSSDGNIDFNIDDVKKQWELLKTLPEGEYNGLIPNIICDIIPLSVSLDRLPDAVKAYKTGEISYEMARKNISNQALMKQFIDQMELKNIALYAKYLSMTQQKSTVKKQLMIYNKYINDQIKSVNDQYDLKIHDINKQHDLRVNDINNQHNNQIKSINDQYDLRVNDINNQYNNQIKFINDQYENQIKSVNDQYENQIKSINDQYENQIESIKKSYDLQVNDINNQYENQVESIKKSYDLQVNDINDQYENKRKYSELCIITDENYKSNQKYQIEQHFIKRKLELKKLIDDHFKAKAYKKHIIKAKLMYHNKRISDENLIIKQNNLKILDAKQKLIFFELSQKNKVINEQLKKLIVVECDDKKKEFTNIEQQIEMKENYKKMMIECQFDKELLIYREYLRLFDDNMIPKMIREQRINEFAKNVDVILKKYTNIDFSIDYTNSKKPKLNIKSINKDRNEKYLSGFEQIMLQIAINYASCPSSKLLIIDEKLDCLDSNNFIKVITDIVPIIKKYYDTIIFVSHRDVPTQIVDHQLKINMHNGVQKYSTINHK